MPRGESTDNEPYNSTDDGEHDEVERHEGVSETRSVDNLDIDPRPAGSKRVEAKERGVDQEEEERLVVSQANASRKPRAVVIHLQNAAAACRAVVGTIGFPGLALLAETKLAIALDGKRCRIVLASLARGKEAISVIVGGRTGIREDGCGITPVEHGV